jgi:hypothetical protein
MGLDLSFTVENDGIDIRLTQVDSDLLSILGRSWPSEVEAFAGVDDFGAARTENRVSLVQAVQTLLEKLDQEADKLPYLYEHAIIDGPYAGISGSGMISGIQIGGDGFYYSIEGGLGRCLLKKQGRRPDGWGYDLEVRDIRDMTSIQTDNMGTIKISRKKKISHLKDSLIKLREFLSMHSDETVSKTLG